MATPPPRIAKVIFKFSSRDYFSVSHQNTNTSIWTALSYPYPFTHNITCIRYSYNSTNDWGWFDPQKFTLEHFIPETCNRDCLASVRPHRPSAFAVKPLCHFLQVLCGLAQPPVRYAEISVHPVLPRCWATLAIVRSTVDVKASEMQKAAEVFCTRTCRGKSCRSMNTET